MNLILKAAPLSLIMNLINDKYLCANSTNYIPEQKHFNLHYLLGVLNSNLINFSTF
jgi:hypothetical protein